MPREFFHSFDVFFIIQQKCTKDSELHFLYLSFISCCGHMSFFLWQMIRHIQTLWLWHRSQGMRNKVTSKHRKLLQLQCQLHFFSDSDAFISVCQLLSWKFNTIQIKKSHVRMMEDIIRLKTFSPLFYPKIHKQQQSFLFTYIRNVGGNCLWILYNITSLYHLPVVVLFPQV